MVPVTPTAIPTVAPVPRVVGPMSVLRVVGVIAVLGVLCVMIPNKKRLKGHLEQ